MEKIKLFKVHQPPHTRYLEETMKSGMYAEGPKTAELEKQLGAFVGTEHTAVLNSGTAALWLSMYLSGVGPGKAVITTPMTSPATNISIPRLGAQILWADVEADSGNISAASVSRLLEKYGDKVAAVIGVNWGGMPCDFDEINKICAGKCMVIEDAAHALGATYKGRLAGSYTDFSCFSFQAIKHITTGDGGMLTCKDEETWNRARRLRWFGIDRSKPGRAFSDDLPEAGFKFHMNDIAASIGLAQLEDLPKILQRRREIAHRYEKELSHLNLQKVPYKAGSAYWLFTLKFSNREQVMKLLEENNIDSSPVHRRNDTYTAFQNCTLGQDDLINTTIFDKEMLCFPVGDWLTDVEVEHVISVLKKV